MTSTIIQVFDRLLAGFSHQLEVTERNIGKLVADIKTAESDTTNPYEQKYAASKSLELATARGEQKMLKLAIGDVKCQAEQLALATRGSKGAI
jgi:hypothetical protein